MGITYTWISLLRNVNKIKYKFKGIIINIKGIVIINITIKITIIIKITLNKNY